MSYPVNSQQRPIRIAIVEDDKTVREGLQMLLNGSPGFACVAAYGNGEDADAIFQSLSAGATGYLLKQTPPARLLEAIQDVYRGGSPMSGEIARKVVQSFQHPIPASGKANGLTKREEEILSYLVKGFFYKEIAGLLFISTETVRTHIRNIYEKLQVRTRSEAILKYLKK